MQSTGDILALVREALDGFDERPLAVTVRRTIRVANLLGESRLAVRLGMDLRPTGGQPSANAEDIRRLLGVEKDSGVPSGVIDEVLDGYIAERMFDPFATVPSSEHLKGKLLPYSLEEIDFWESVADPLTFTDAQKAEQLPFQLVEANVRIRVRHRCYVALCDWERSLTYTDTNEQIFGRFRSDVDKELGRLAPEVLDKFRAVYRRLGEATQGAAPVSEELSQALVTCRRILEAVADHVWPPDRPATLKDGSPATGTQYRARMRCFLRERGGDSFEGLIGAEVSGLYGRFEAADRLSSKGVHADVALREAEAAAILTYIIAGNLLRLAQETPATSAAMPDNASPDTPRG